MVKTNLKFSEITKEKEILVNIMVLFHTTKITIMDSEKCIVKIKKCIKFVS